MTHKPGVVLCAVQPDRDMSHIIGAAKQIAYTRSLNLHLLHVVKPHRVLFSEYDVAQSTFVEETFERAALENASRKLTECAAAHGLAGEQVSVRQGIVVDEIARVVQELQATCVVMGLHNRSGLRRILGSTTRKVLHAIELPLYAIHAQSNGQAGYSRPMIAVNASPETSMVLNAAKPVLADAQEYDVYCVIEPLFADLSPDAFAANWPIRSMHKQLRKDLAHHLDGQLQAAGLESAQLTIECGDPVHEICAYAKSQAADLIVIGPGEGSGVRRFLLGSTAHGVLDHAPCDVYVARDSDFTRSQQELKSADA